MYRFSRRCECVKGVPKWSKWSINSTGPANNPFHHFQQNKTKSSIPSCAVKCPLATCDKIVHPSNAKQQTNYCCSCTIESFTGGVCLLTTAAGSREHARSFSVPIFSDPTARPEGNKKERRVYLSHQCQGFVPFRRDFRSISLRFLRL